MKNIKLQIELTTEDLENIKRFYGTFNIKIVEAVVKDILGRYLNIEHFDPKLL